MSDKNKAWSPSEKQEAPKKKAVKKTSKAAEKKAKVEGLNADGNVAGSRVTFEQIQQGMKKQSQPVIERSSRRKR